MILKLVKKLTPTKVTKCLQNMLHSLHIACKLLTLSVKCSLLGVGTLQRRKWAELRQIVYLQGIMGLSIVSGLLLGVSRMRLVLKMAPYAFGKLTFQPSRLAMHQLVMHQ